MRRESFLRLIGFFAVLAVPALQACAQHRVIPSAYERGYVTFHGLSDGTNYNYRVEWASAASGPWTNFQEAAAQLDAIVPFAAGSYTSTVPMCFRVVAVPTNAPPAGMVLVPGGANVGSDPDFGGYSLSTESFFLDKYEVTKALWDEVRNWSSSNGYGIDNAGAAKGADHPIISINWYDVVKWCNARSEKEGREPAYYTDAAHTQVYRTGDVTEPYVKASTNGYRLPMAQQWEYAARGGVTGRRFPWGDTISHNEANYCSYSSGDSYDTGYEGYDTRYSGDSYPYTSPVGSFAPNGYGAYDMTGNVHEWCWDWYPGMTSQARVDRGGSWADGADRSRTGFRDYCYPNGGGMNVGFRCVLPTGQ